MVVALRQGPHDPGQRPAGIPGPVEHDVEVPEREVGRDEIEAGEVGRRDRLPDVGLVPHERLAPPPDLRRRPEVPARRPLGIEVEHQHAGTVARPRDRRPVGEVDDGRRLSDAALHVVGRQDGHQRASYRRWRRLPVVGFVLRPVPARRRLRP